MEKFYSSQPPSGHSGAPGSNGTCANCHGNLNTGGGAVSFTGLPSFFQPGVSYPFSVTINHPGSRERWGFQINARNTDGSPVGTFSTTNPNAATGGPAELSHNNAVFSTGTSYTYTNLTWTAPATIGSGDNMVTFYLAGNAANGDANSTGDFIYTNTGQSTLPITIKSLDYKVEGDQVTLYWASASENNSKEYAVEKSDDSRKFEVIGHIPASGNSLEEKAYAFTDKRPSVFNQPVYYRLKMVDLDGGFRYSKTISLIVRKHALFVHSLVPNPASDHILVTASSDKQVEAGFAIADVSGKIVARKTAVLQNGRTNHLMDIATLQKGTYFLILQTKEFKQTLPFIKQ